MPREDRNAEGASAPVVVIYGYRGCERKSEADTGEARHVAKVPGPPWSYTTNVYLDPTRVM
jgi:hypothetical protein